MKETIEYGVSRGRRHGYQMTNSENQIQVLRGQIKVVEEVDQNIEQIPWKPWNAEQYCNRYQENSDPVITANLFSQVLIVIY